VARSKIPQLPERDALFHQPAFNEPSWLETNWFPFLVPERNLRGHVYIGFRTNLGVVFGGVMIWTRDCQSHLDYDYYDTRVHLPMPTSNLDHYRLENGICVKMVEPLQHYLVSYEGFNGMALELEFKAMMQAVDSHAMTIPGGHDFSHFHAVKSALSDSVGHIDQTMMVTGNLRLHGEDIAVAFASNRDHTWGPRPEYGHGQGYFDEGFFGEDLCFHVQTKSDESNEGIVTNGYIIKQGELRKLKAGIGRYTRSGWATTKLEYELEDETGETFLFVGEPTAIAPLPTWPNQYNIAGLTRWTNAGETGWGEYKWHWEVSEMIQHRRR